MMAHERRVGRALLVLSLVVFGWTTGGSLASTDAVVTFDLTRSLVEHRSVALSGNLLGLEAHRGPDGRFYSPFGLAQSVWNIPFYLVGRAAVAWGGARMGQPDSVPKAAVALGQVPLSALGVWLTYRLALLIGGSVGSAVFAALSLAFATLWWPYAGAGFNQPLAAVALLGAVTDATSGVRNGRRGRLVRCGVWLAAGLLTRHELVLAAVPVAVGIALAPAADLRQRLTRVGRLAPGLAGGLAIWLIYNAVRFGDPLDSGYLRDPIPGIGSPILTGLAGLLFSPAASLLLYSPVLLVGLAGAARLASRDRALAVLVLAPPCVLLLFYATLANWIGGRSYGGRYLVAVLPLLMAPAALACVQASGRARRAALALASVSCLLQIPGVAIDYGAASQLRSQRTGAPTAQRAPWSFDASPLAVNTTSLVEAVPRNAAYLLGRAEPPDVAPTTGRGFSQQFAFSLSFWWLYLYYFGVIGGTGVLVLILAAAGSVAGLGWLLMHRMGPPPATEPSC